MLIFNYYIFPISMIEASTQISINSASTLVLLSLYFPLIDSPKISNHFSDFFNPKLNRQTME